MDKHSATQSNNARPDSLRFASCKYKRVVKHTSSGFKELIVELDDMFAGRSKGTQKAHIHRRIRRKSKERIWKETE